ncbi:hypothetical protein ACQCSU_06335 [Pseudarthrobacter sp. O4]|uniref:hypothetical protein n=1 Tax=Pseudarthrobacter sp. O4 TaxID=3418417 RepID=UPI003CFB78A0
MVEFTTRRLIAAAAIAGALSLSACVAPAAAPEPAGATAAASTEATEATATSEAEAATSAPAPTPPPTAAGPEPVPYAQPQGGIDVDDPAAIQSALAQNFITELVTNKYSLSGQWVEDGGSHAITAKLWDNRFSDNLKAKLIAAGKDGDVSTFGNWAVFALPGPDSKDAVKASPACAAAPETHCLFIQEIDGDTGAMQQAGGAQEATMDQSVPNRVAFDYDVVVPVSLTEKGNAEGVMKGVLKVEMTYVPNPNLAAGGPDFLIDSINNKLTGAETDVLAGSPDLTFESY